MTGDSGTTIQSQLKTKGQAQKWWLVTVEFEEMRQAEKASGRAADPQMDAFLMAQTIEGDKESITTDYMLKILGLDVSPFCLL